MSFISEEIIRCFQFIDIAEMYPTNDRSPIVIFRCFCGSHIIKTDRTFTNGTRHLKTEKHQRFMRESNISDYSEIPFRFPETQESLNCYVAEAIISALGHFIFARMVDYDVNEVAQYIEKLRSNNQRQIGEMRRKFPGADTEQFIKLIGDILVF